MDTADDTEASGVSRAGRVARLAPWAAFACCIAALMAVWYYQVLAQRGNVRLETALAADLARQRVESCIDLRAEALAHTAGRWPSRLIYVPAALRSRATEIMAWMPGVVEVAVLDHTGIVVVGVTDEAGRAPCLNEGAQFPVPAPAATAGDFDADAPRAWGPPPGGSAGLELLAWPARWPGDFPGGWLVAVIDLEELVAACARDGRLEADFHLALRDQNGALRQSLGDPAAVAASPHAHSVTQRVLDGTWTWSVAPTAALLRRARAPGMLLIPVLGAAVSLGIALLMRSIPIQAEARRRSEQRLRRLINLLPHMIYAAGPDGRILFANQACADAFGRPVRTLPGRTLAQLGIPPAQAAALAAADARVIAEHDGGHTPRQPFTERSGRERLLEIARVPVPGRGGEETAVLVIATDITGRIEAEAELARHRMQLEELVYRRTAALEEAQRGLVRSEKLATLGQLMATVSHELRNPLGTIATALYTIARATREAGLPGVDRAVDRAERNIRRCEAIIDELLDYARVHPPRLERRDFDDWLRQTLDEYPLPRDVELEARLAAGVAPKFDPERLRRAVVNLLDNACHAIAEARAADPGRPGRLRVATGVDARGLWCAIADSGTGIPEAELERVFEPLYSTRSFGLGLGLAIVRQVVEQHGGEVVLDTAPDGGLTATIRLPLGDAEQAA